MTIRAIRQRQEKIHLDGLLHPDFQSVEATLRRQQAKYASPEQLGGEKVIDQRSDLYSLGILLFRLLSGRLPFDDRSTMAISKRIVPARSYSEDI